jgi:hypothetical protein
MARIGVFLIIMSIGSVLLPMINMQFIILAWINTWGPDVAWVIRGVLLVIGVALVVIEKRTGRGG